jgi:hypothetical protein
MRFYLLLVLIPTAAYAAASIAAALAAAAAWPRLRRRAGSLASGERACLLAAWRLAPAAAGSAVALVLLGAFVRFEPRTTTEDPGVLLVAAAIVALLLTAQAARRTAQALRAGIRCNRLLRRCGRPVMRGDGTHIWLVDTDYPVAAVTGIFRTRLLVSTRILRECTPGEVDAVLRHEQAHVRRRDNLVRGAMLALPNPLSLVQAGDEMQHAWSAAAEESADDVAAGQEAASRTALASALVRVAKMARTPAPPWMPALAFYEGTNLEHRVRRLLGDSTFSNRMPLRVTLALTAAAGAWAFALTETAAIQVHAWMELAVRLVP